MPRMTGDALKQALTELGFRLQRRFNDEITGHSGLTFFEAYTSEVGYALLQHLFEHDWLTFIVHSVLVVKR
jgi:hypothetical protein